MVARRKLYGVFLFLDAEGPDLLYLLSKTHAATQKPIFSYGLLVNSLIFKCPGSAGGREKRCTVCKFTVARRKLYGVFAFLDAEGPDLLYLPQKTDEYHGGGQKAKVPGLG